MNNLVKRTVFGILYVAVLVTSLVIYTPMFPALVIIATYLMMSEFFAMSMGENYIFAQKMAILAAVCLFATFWCHFAFGLSVRWMQVSFLPLLIAMASVLFDKDRENLHLFAYVLTGLLYAGIPAALLPVIVFKDGEFSGWLLLCFFIIIWSSDVGAYCLGSLFGQRPGAKKLAPSISPKKSWIGVWSGLAFAIGAAFALNALGWIDFGIVHTIAFGLVVSAAGVVGDLFESVWKRYFHVKDSGNAIPGHGGMLDRFDSSLFAIPAGTLYLAIFNLL